MLEPDKNPNPSFMVDPPRLARRLISTKLSRIANSRRIARQRERFEVRRNTAGEPRRVEYFHQFDDPYCHLTAQVLARFAERYDIEIVPHLVRAAGGRNQPELEKLAAWSRRDVGLVAPHYGLTFPGAAGIVPEAGMVAAGLGLLAKVSADEFVNTVCEVSTMVWGGKLDGSGGGASEQEMKTALDEGSKRLARLGHYSGASFYYGGEWYWGVDRLFHLEQRLRDLGLCRVPDEPFLVTRPSLDVEGMDASALTLDFYPSLNSPYTSIIFDRTISLAMDCGITLRHKPVLPMIMRGVPATNAKGSYILFDTKREADFFGIPFGPLVMPIGEPTRRAYSLLPWAREQGKDVALMSSLLRRAFAQGVGLHTNKGMRLAVEAAGLDWGEALKVIGSDGWKAEVERSQDEMVEGMGLWGVPSYRLSGPDTGPDTGADTEPDLEVWGQDRLWLVAAEIRRRAAGQ